MMIKCEQACIPTDERNKHTNKHAACVETDCSTQSCCYLPAATDAAFERSSVTRTRRCRAAVTDDNARATIRTRRPPRARSVTIAAQHQCGKQLWQTLLAITQYSRQTCYVFLFLNLKDLFFFYKPQCYLIILVPQSLQVRTKYTLYTAY